LPCGLALWSCQSPSTSSCVSEFIAYAKASPGKINMASQGNGASGHLAGELFKMTAGIDMVHVPFRGAAPALTDLLGGQVQLMYGSAASSIEYIRTSKLRALAATSLLRCTVYAVNRLAGCQPRAGASSAELSSPPF
jgi:tripartite-type tricarboxylate transporter receptor subunit TctC